MLCYIITCIMFHNASILLLFIIWANLPHYSGCMYWTILRDIYIVWIVIYVTFKIIYCIHLYYKMMIFKIKTKYSTLHAMNIEYMKVSFCNKETNTHIHTNAHLQSTYNKLNYKVTCDNCFIEPCVLRAVLLKCVLGWSWPKWSSWSSWGDRLRASWSKGKIYYFSFGHLNTKMSQIFNKQCTHVVLSGSKSD